MKTAKASNRNEFSSIQARINDIMGGAWNSSAASTHPSKKNRPQSSKHASKVNYTAAPRAWNESFAFSIDG